MIKIEHLFKKFGKNEVLKDLSLFFDSKGIFAILGPNGSGKTTLIKCLLGMTIPDKGEIKINGESILGKYSYRSNIGYLPQIANFPNNLTVRELIHMMKNIRNQRNLDETSLAQRLGLNEYLSKKLNNLSGGTKQKVNLLITFLFDNQIIILDEPTSGLDPKAVIILKEIIQEKKEEGKLILITSHIMQFVEEIADEVVFLLEGKVYFKGSIQLLQQQTNENDFEHAIVELLNLNENVENNKI